MTLPPERPGMPAPPAVLQARSQLAAAIAAGHFRSDWPVGKLRRGGVRVLRVGPAGEIRARVLHFHGGGYRLGAPETDLAFAQRLADLAGAELLLPAYRLAPEHPFPAGLADGLAVLEALAAEADGLPLFLSGASAGGGIAAALAVLTAQRLPLAGLMLHSPWLDLTLTAASLTANGPSDPLFSAEAARLAAALYLQGADAAQPLVSPLLADLAGLPPVLVSAGSGEVLVDDARGFDARLRAAAVPSRCLIIADMTHVAVTRDPALTGADEVLQAAADFVRER